MNHCGTQTIETERLVLRRFASNDAEAMYRNWTSDPEVTKFLTWPVHRSVEDSEEVLKKWISSYEKKDYYQWAIVLKDHGSDPIGSIAAVDQDDDALITFFFDTVGANRVESRHDPRNPHSGMVMQKCGMKYEGTLRASDRNNQGICDACWYAILKTER